MRADPAVRAALVVAAGTAAAVPAPAAVAAPLVLGAVAAVAQAAVRHRGRGGVDALLVAAGGVLVVPVLLGLVLGVTGIGLRPVTWAAGLTLVGLAVLGLTARRGAAGTALAGGPSAAGEPRTGAVRAGAALRLLPWFAVVGVVAAVAVGRSVSATEADDVAPLQMSLGAARGGTVEIVVSGDEAAGPLELRTDPGDGTSLSYPLFRVRPGQPVTTTVVLPRRGRSIVTLNNPDQTAPLRLLVLDR